MRSGSSMNWFAVVPSLGLVLVMAVTYLSTHDRPTPLPIGNKNNVLLITLDTLRTDGLGCYGNPQALTPFLDSMSRRSALFTDVVVPVPMTTPSHASLLTATIPSAHGAAGNAYRLPPENESLAEILLACGYRTGAFVSCFPLARKFGLDQGFQIYDDKFVPRGGVKELLLASLIERVRHRGRLERSAADLNKAALPWLASSATNRFFAWLHYFDPHAPYAAPLPYRTMFDGRLSCFDLQFPPGVTLDLIKSAVDQHLPAEFDADLPVERYLAEIAWLDNQLNVLFRHLAERELFSNTVVIITADHGESLTEHGEIFSHGATLYDPSMKVPLLLRWPDLPASRIVNTSVRSIDIAPTILDILHLQLGKSMAGTSLCSLANGLDEPHRPAVIENLGIIMVPGAKKQRGYRTHDWKLIEQEGASGQICQATQLYNLHADPLELLDQCDTMQEIVTELQFHLEKDITGTAPASSQPIVVIRDDQTLENLRKLGYL